MNSELEAKLERIFQLKKTIDDAEQELAGLLFRGGSSKTIDPPELKRQGRKGKKRKMPDTSTPGKFGKQFKFTDAQIAKMVKRINAGEKVAVIAEEYGCSGATIYYYLKKQERKTENPDEPAPDDTDQEGADESQLISANPADFRYEYECTCGFRFKSKIPPQLVKCPDCKGRPRCTNDPRQ